MDMCTVRRAEKKEKEPVNNYRLRFSVMSMGLLTAHGEPHMLAGRTLMLRSTEK